MAYTLKFTQEMNRFAYFLFMITPFFYRWWFQQLKSFIVIKRGNQHYSKRWAMMNVSARKSSQNCKQKQKRRRKGKRFVFIEIAFMSFFWSHPPLSCCWLSVNYDKCLFLFLSFVLLASSIRSLDYWQKNCNVFENFRSHFAFIIEHS